MPTNRRRRQHDHRWEFDNPRTKMHLLTGHDYPLHHQGPTPDDAWLRSAWNELRDELLAEHVGKPVSQIAKDTERDYYMSADEALAYGVIDQVMSGRSAAAPDDRPARSISGGQRG